MKKTIFTCFMFVVCIALPLNQAFAIKVFEGHVEDILNRFIRYDIVVKGYDGRKIIFRTGATTRYVPERMPIVGERVRIDYLVRRKAYIARAVKVISPNAPYPKPPVPLKQETIHQPDLLLSGQLTVVKPHVNIRSGPGTDYRITGGVIKGQRLVLNGQTKSWYYVFMPERQQEGWIHLSMVKVDKIEIPPSTPDKGPEKMEQDQQPAESVSTEECGGLIPEMRHGKEP